MKTAAADRTDAYDKAGPPPNIPLPPAPPEDTRFSVDLRRQMDIPDTPKVETTDVKLVPIPPDKLPSLTAASGPLPPIRLEASYVEPTTLTDVLSIALQNNLPIKVAQTEFRSKRFGVVASAGSLLPNMATGYTNSRTWFNGGRSDAPSFYNIIYLPVFNGGQDVFRLLRSVHEAKASNFSVSTTTNDVLLDAYEKYQDLLLQYALLQVR
ncbi:MAG: TolC family protein, partial [Candidatus Melainabacteria bacterium]|nr:TolC family protein [Candidatus Melainabacteria bacterium]